MEKLLFNEGDEACGGVSVSELIHRAVHRLPASPSARLDAELLLAHLLGCDRAGVVVRLRDRCPHHVEVAFDRLVARRAGGEPLAYLVQKREFWGLEFEVTPDVLVPRPESELLVEEGVRVCEGLPSPRIVDLGTGSGCLIIALAVTLRARGLVRPHFVAVDSSAEALAVARRNAARHGVEAQISWIQSDWFGSREAFSPPYDLVVANPPYLDRSEQHPVELAFEPEQALYAADGGWREVQRICQQVSSMLAPSGVFLCEIGAGKRAALSQLPVLSDAQRELSLLGDASPSDRFTVLRIAPRDR